MAKHMPVLWGIRMIPFLGSMAVAMAPQLPSIPSGTFDIADYGAVADDSTDNATAIQKALTAAESAGGGTVVVPAASKAFASGPLTISSHVRLEVDSGATLAILKYGKYPLSGSSYTTWLTSKNATDIEICGRGTIDGQGLAWWTAFNSNSSMPHRPYMINLQNGARIHVHQITLKNSPMFHLVLTNDSDVTVDSVTILAPSSAPNTDGIDPSGKRFLIRDDSVSVGDDNIAIKAGGAFCQHFVITRCRFGTGHGLSVGGQSSDGLDSLLVTNCRFTGTTNGIRLKANRTNGGLSRHIRYDSLTMTGVQYPIYFTSYYGNSSPSLTDPDSTITSLTPIWKDIVVANLVSTNGASNATAGFLWGLPEMPLDSIMLVNVKITATKPMVVTHVTHLSLFNCAISPSTITANDAMPVQSAPTFAIVAPPLSDIDSVGDAASFWVVATGTSPLSYQWYKDGVALSDGAGISGSRNRVLTLSELKLEQAGSYAVNVSDMSGAGTSDAASLAVLGASATTGIVRHAPRIIGGSGQKVDLLGRSAGRAARSRIEYVPGQGWVQRTVVSE